MSTGASRVLILVILLFYGVLALFLLGWSDLGSDEGRFGISALNILSDPRQLAVVSEDPLGGPGTKPYLYPLALAASIALLGKTEFAVRVVNVVALALGAFLLYFTVRDATRRGGLAMLSFALFLLNPWSITYARTAMPEPLVVTFGILSLFAAERSSRAQSTGWAMLCGVALGLAYLSKLWLVAPYVLACGCIFLAVAIQYRNRKAVICALAALVMFIISASSHLLLTCVLAPDLFGYWWQTYFLFSAKTRVGGAGYDPVMWLKPWWFYIGAIFKATAFILPPFFLGVYQLVRGRSLLQLAILLAILSPVAIYSPIAVKQATYVYPAFPGVAFAAGVGFHTLRRCLSHTAMVVAIGLSTIAALIFFAQGLLGTAELGALIALYALYWAVICAPMRERRSAYACLAAAVVCASLAADAITVRRTLQHRTYYREIAAFSDTRLSAVKPDEKVFIAPEFPALEFYMFHSGEYWHTYYVDKPAASLAQDLENRTRRLFVVDTTGTLYGSTLSDEAMRMLIQQTREITSEIEKAARQRLAVRVFEL